MNRRRTINANESVIGKFQTKLSDATSRFLDDLKDFPKPNSNVPNGTRATIESAYLYVYDLNFSSEELRKENNGRSALTFKPRRRTSYNVSTPIDLKSFSLVV